MKWSVALFFAGFFGALGTAFVLLSFGTDYWLLASENCNTDSNIIEASVCFVLFHHMAMNQVEDAGNFSIFHHEGFFWHCSFVERKDEDTLLKFWFTNQPQAKVCKHAYLSPFPVSEQTHNATVYESAIIFRGFWSVFMLLGVFAIILGGFIIICAAPFTNSCLFKAGGGLFLIAGFFILLAIVLSVIWLELMDVFSLYVNYQKTHKCSGFQLNTMYGLSFMFAPVGVFFSLLSGLLFLLIGRAAKKHY